MSAHKDSLRAQHPNLTPPALGGPHRRRTLEARLIDLLSSVPSGIESMKLKEFCKACAKMRNDLSHRGHSEDAAATANPLQFVALKNEIVSFLYHAKLLLEIGVSREIVGRWLTNSRDSHRLAWFLEQAGVQTAKADGAT